MKKLFLVNFTFQFRASPFVLIKCDVLQKYVQNGLDLS